VVMPELAILDNLHRFSLKPTDLFPSSYGKEREKPSLVGMFESDSPNPKVQTLRLDADPRQPVGLVS